MGVAISFVGDAGTPIYFCLFDRSESTFGITQMVDGKWGVHAVIKKDILASGET